MKKITWHYKSFQDLTALELYKIIQQRINVFIIEQDCIYQDCDSKDLVSDHLWAEVDGELAAYCRIVPPNVSYKNDVSIGRVISNLKFRGQNFGRQLLIYALEVLDNQSEGISVRISAQLYLKKFYESFGFEQVSDEYLEDDIPHIEMLIKK